MPQHNVIPPVETRYNILDESFTLGGRESVFASEGRERERERERGREGEGERGREREIDR